MFFLLKVPDAFLSAAFAGVLKKVVFSLFDSNLYQIRRGQLSVEQLVNRPTKILRGWDPIHKERIEIEIGMVKARQDLFLNRLIQARKVGFWI